MAKPAKFTILGDSSSLIRALQQVNDEARKTESKMKKVGENLTSVGKKLTIGLTTPLLALGASSARAASELEQSIGGTEAVFGDASEAIDKFAETSAQSIGLAESEFRTSTTLIGGQLKRMTGDVDFAADSAIQLTEVGADLAATYGGTTKEAVDAFAAALRGEADPAERFNLNLKVSAVNAKAVELGLASSTSEVDDNAKAQALLALVMEQSADAQGQFAREAETAAGQQQRLSAEWEDARAELGNELLPVLVDAAGVVRDLIGRFSDLSPEMKQTIITVGGVAAAAGPLLVVAGKLVTAVDKLKNSSFSLSKALGSPLTGPLVIATGLAVGFAAVLQRNKSRTDDWADAIGEGGTALNEFADELIATEIVQRDLEGSMSEAGVTAADLKDAILGDRDAFQEFVAKLGPGQRDLLTWVEAQRIAREKADEHKRAIDEQKGALEDFSNRIPVFGGAMAGYIQSTDTATGSTNDLEDAVVSLADEQKKAVDPLFNLISANEDLDAAQRAYNEALVEHGPKSEEARQAGVDLAEAQLELNSATARYAEEGGPEAVDVLKDTLAQAGLTEEMIRAIIAAIHDLNATEVTNPITRGGGGGAQAFDTGGVIPGRKGEPKLILAHAGETVLSTHKKGPAEAFADQFGLPSPAGAQPITASSGAAPMVFNFPNYVGDKAELARIVRDEFVKVGRRNGNTGI